MNDSSQSLGENALPYWRWTGAIASAFFLLLPVAYWIGRRYVDLPLWPGVILLLLAIVLVVYKVLIAPAVMWKTWRYDVSAEEISLFYGVLIKTRIVIPMVKVQYVDTEQGPLMRCYGLAAVSISTAAGEHKIPALSADVAEELRDKIGRLARVVDEDV